MLFWQDVTDADAYRLATLSGYSRKLHKPYDTYLKEQELELSIGKQVQDTQDRRLMQSVVSW